MMTYIWYNNYNYNIVVIINNWELYLRFLSAVSCFYIILNDDETAEKEKVN